MAEIKVYNMGSTGFDVKLIDLQTKDITYTRKCLWTVYEASSYQSVAGATTDISPGYEEGGDCSFSGLSPNTGYFVDCYITRTDTGAWLTSLATETFYTNSSGGGGGGEEPDEPDEPDVPDEPDEPDEPSVNIAKWDWTKSNGTATDDAVFNTYWTLALHELYGTEGFSHMVWNDMVEKVAEIRRAKGWNWDLSYATKVGTKMMYDDYHLYAYQFNSLRNNIEIVGSNIGIGLIPEEQIPHPVYSGNDVLVSYFRTLTDYMNACIDNL